MAKHAYDVRARYGGDLTWIHRCATLWGLLWFLAAELRGRGRRHPDWPEAVLRYEVVRVPATHVEGWDPLRKSFRLGGRGAEVRLEEERRERVLKALEAADGPDELPSRLEDFLLDPAPDGPPDERPMARMRGMLIRRR